MEEAGLNAPAFRSRKTTSTVWNFFTKTNQVNKSGTKMAKCKECGDLVTCENTTNMNKHLQRAHTDKHYVNVKTGIKVTRPLALYCGVFTHTSPHPR